MAHPLNLFNNISRATWSPAIQPRLAMKNEFISGLIFITDSCIL
jgi:hypothetical protein